VRFARKDDRQVHLDQTERQYAGLLTIGLLSGCVTTVSREDTRRMGDAVLCMQYGHWLKQGNPEAVANVTAEMSSRGISAPSANENDFIRRESVAIGMSECGALAAMGSPDAQNSTLTASGRRTQYVFRPFAGRRGAYAYTEAGRVTAIQN
jgi:hypothetical protein